MHVRRRVLVLLRQLPAGLVGQALEGQGVRVDLGVRLVVLAGVVEHEDEVAEALVHAVVAVLLELGRDDLEVNRVLDDLVIIWEL